MPDDFRQWGLKDVDRLGKLMAVELAWLRDLRHSSTESIDNEKARTRELSDALFKFNNERLAGNGGKRWVPEEDAGAVVKLGPLKERSGQWVHDTLAAAIPKVGDGVNRWPLDSRYYLCSQDDMAAIIQADYTDAKAYWAERYDCENFAFTFKALVDRVYGLNQVGLVMDWSGGHGYNVIVFTDDVWFFEPMNDQTVGIGAGIYKMERADILI